MSKLVKLKATSKGAVLAGAVRCLENQHMWTTSAAIQWRFARVRRASRYRGALLASTCSVRQHYRG